MFKRWVKTPFFPHELGKNPPMSQGKFKKLPHELGKNQKENDTGTPVNMRVCPRTRAQEEYTNCKGVEIEEYINYCLPTKVPLFL